MSGRRERIAETLKIPKESLCKDMVLTVIGKREALIENYRGIIDYTTTEILVQGIHHKVKISGRQLTIIYYTNDDMKIRGYIHQIEYI